MIIEIRRAGFVNKGAELMLVSALEMLSERYPDACFVMAPTLKKGTQPFNKLARLGFYPKAWLWKYGVQWGDLATLLPNRLREMYGVVLDKEVDVVIDAAGFSYSDQWGESSSIELSRSCGRWKKRGTKVILLPQAMGPYSSSKICRAISKVAEHADLIFPRESTSYNNLVGVVGERDNIYQSPDFTNLMSGVVPDYFDSNTHKFCIVPNYRMIDKTNEKERESYIPFLSKCVKYLHDKKCAPFFLIHELDKDESIVKEVLKSCGIDIPVVRENDPLHIKGILGMCEGSIGSRYHGLVSTLSQGVPSLATGWSHKYARLFEDYDFPDGMLRVDSSDEEIREKIDLVTNHDSKKEIREKLAFNSNVLKAKSLTMWEKVFEVIDS